jgi:ribosomal protein L7/L12
LEVSRVEEREFGWIFFYVANKLSATGRKRLAIAGNAPFLVERDSGRVLELGTAYPVDHYVGNYLKTGDPHGELGEIVLLLAAHYGAKKISAVKSIRKHTNLGLRDAKLCVDRCLDGERVEIKTADASAAECLAKELRDHYFVAEQQKRTA